ncbi:MAG: leucine-rich repeat domain-containing protein, partial [Bacilli bacterium]|nr:leucine-rich repeat domain-containing protein [Bacilli bacterium]
MRAHKKEKNHEQETKAAWDNLEAYGFARCKITGAVIPEGFKSIGVYALSDNHLMTTASIPSTVTSLQEM